MLLLSRDMSSKSHLKKRLNNSKDDIILLIAKHQRKDFMEYTRNKDNDYYLISLPSKLDDKTSEFIDETVKLCESDINNNGWIVFDGKDLLDYTIKGLKQIRRLRDITNQVIFLNLSDEMFDLFYSVGYTTIFFVYKTFKEIELKDAKYIGGGQNGSVYDLGNNVALKVFADQVSLYEIVKEEQITKWAFNAGIPTSISFGLYKVNGSLAFKFEYIKTKGLSKYITEDPENIDEYIKAYANFLKQIDLIIADKNLLPSKKKEFIAYAKDIQNALDEKHFNKLMNFIESIPDSDTIVHGDAHTRNVRYSKDGLKVIDLGDLGYGDPIFELASMFATYVGYRIISKNDIVKIGNDNYHVIWDKLIKYSFPNLSDDEIKDKENRYAALAYTRILRHCINYNELKENIELIKNKLNEALDKI